MYAVAVESYGKFGLIVPAGNNGMMKLHNKTRRGWMKETEFFRKHTTGKVYVISDFTQKMCEMSPKQLAKYITENHICTLERI